MDPDLAQVAGLARGDRTGDAAPSPTLLHLLRSHFEYEDEFGWDGELFDGATCEMALMDIDDLEGTVNAVARVLRPDGVFVRVWLLQNDLPVRVQASLVARDVEVPVVGEVAREVDGAEAQQRFGGFEGPAHAGALEAVAD